MGNTQHHAAALDVQREVADMNRDAAHLEKKTSRDEIHSGDGNGNKNSASSGNSSGNGNGSIRMLPQAMTPSRITRNVTHTTHATYDDSASLSTCATNPVLINKASFSNDANSQVLEEHNLTPSPLKAQHPKQAQAQAQTVHSQSQRKMQIQKKMKFQQQANKAKLVRSKSKLEKDELGGKSKSPSDTNSSQFSRPTGPLEQRQQHQVVGVMYASPRQQQQQQQQRPIYDLDTGVITEEDKWKNAWEEDTESSDEEDRRGGTVKNTLLKAVARRNKSDTKIIPKKGDQILEAGRNCVNYEKPSIMMFFPLLRVLGKGSFGKVVLVQKRSGKEKGGLFAMKILRKVHLLHRGQIERTRTERSVLAMVNHPFIMRLHFAFQSNDKLFLVLDYCAGGELFFHLSRNRRFPEKWTRFYAAELLLALGHLHTHGIIYRDLKPENVLLDSDGHVKLGDFGLAKAGIEHPFRGAVSRVGTPEYMAPEILQQKGHGFCVDYWGLGMLTYEMMTGLPPWYTTDRQKLFKRLNHAPLDIPLFFSPHAASFVGSLLQRDPRSRLGVRGNQSVISHDFFRRLDFKALLARQIEAPILPCEGWKAPKTLEKSGKSKKNLIRGMFGSGNSSNRNMGMNQLPSEELDAATANFDKQFTRMALSSVSGHGEDECSERGNYCHELNENTFVGFTFDDGANSIDPHI